MTLENSFLGGCISKTDNQIDLHLSEMNMSKITMKFWDFEGQVLSCNFTFGFGEISVIAHAQQQPQSTAFRLQRMRIVVKSNFRLEVLDRNESRILTP